MKNFVGVCLGFLLCIVGCGDKKHHSCDDPGKLYLKEVIVEVDNTVIATINLPDYHYGLIFLNGSNVALEIVLKSGDINLGVFNPGEYSLCLELFLSPDGELAWEQHLTCQDLTGITECYDFIVPMLDDQPILDPLPPEDFPRRNTNPELVCQINEDGAVVLVVQLGGSDSVIFHRYFDEKNDMLIVEDFAHIVEYLKCGEYAYSILDSNTLKEITKCIVVIPCVPDDNDDELPILPPKPEDPRTRFLICHNGHQILVPWQALRAHLLIHEDELGRCNKD